ncbi:MAG: isochorismatase family protein [Gammaproteobacteria bacterium]|nr:MAG: isochorismatase family protein [Gammaproteobacteria bacterium]|tara:strand:+ start:16953 stop:17579 length:627 start_codon:yes stop_codon:yes gene_type:complete
MNKDLDQNYKAVFNKRLGFGKNPAIILVDFVAAYFDENSPLYADVEKALLSAIRIRNKGREKNIPIIYTNVSYQKDGKNGGVFFEKLPVLSCFIEGAKTAGWPSKLDIDPNEIVITKQYPSAFFETCLSKKLNNLEIDTLIITGLTTSGCIRATCVDAISYGFRPIVVKDACGDRHEKPHIANLFDMNAKYADVVSENEVFNFLCKQK